MNKWKSFEFVEWGLCASDFKGHSRDSSAFVHIEKSNEPGLSFINMRAFKNSEVIAALATWNNGNWNKRSFSQYWLLCFTSFDLSLFKSSSLSQVPVYFCIMLLDTRLFAGNYQQSDLLSRHFQTVSIPYETMYNFSFADSSPTAFATVRRDSLGC